MSTYSDFTAHPDVQSVVATSESLLVLGSGYLVKSAEDYQHAGIELKRVKEAQKRLTELRQNITRPIDIAKKAVLDFFREPEAKLDRAEAGIKGAMLSYQQEEDRRRREAQARAEEIARKEREKLAAQAAKAAAKGKIEQAAVLEQAAAATVAPVVPAETPKVAGVSTRRVVRFEVVDPAAVPREFCCPDEAKIRKYATALGTDAAITGVRIWVEEQLAASSR